MQFEFSLLIAHPVDLTICQFIESVQLGRQINIGIFEYKLFKVLVKVARALVFNLNFPLIDHLYIEVVLKLKLCFFYSFKDSFGWSETWVLNESFNIVKPLKSDDQVIPFNSSLLTFSFHQC